MDTEHTPLPWEHEGDEIFHPTEAQDADPMTVVYDEQMSDADAALIVHSVNLHADLVAALRKASQLASVAGDWNLDEVEIDGEMVRTFELQEQFDALLAKASS